MVELVERFKKHISLGSIIGNLVVILFMAGGFYYTTTYEIEGIKGQINNTGNEFDSHMEFQYRPLRDQVQDNTERIVDSEANYRAIRDLLEQQKQSNESQFKEINARLDYIINRLDAKQ